MNAIPPDSPASPPLLSLPRFQLPALSDEARAFGMSLGRRFDSIIGDRGKVRFFTQLGIHQETLLAWREGKLLPAAELFPNLLVALGFATINKKEDEPEPVKILPERLPLLTEKNITITGHGDTFKNLYLDAFDAVSTDQPHAFFMAPDVSQSIRPKSRKHSEDKSEAGELEPFYELIDNLQAKRHVSTANLDKHLSDAGFSRYFFSNLKKQNVFPNLLALKIIIQTLHLSGRQTPSSQTETEAETVVRSYIEGKITPVESSETMGPLYEAMPKAYWQQVLRDARDLGTYVVASRHMLGFTQIDFTAEITKIAGLGITGKWKGLTLCEQNAVDGNKERYAGGTTGIKKSSVDAALKQSLLQLTQNLGAENWFDPETFDRLAAIPPTEADQVSIRNRLSKIQPTHETVVAATQEIMNLHTARQKRGHVSAAESRKRGGETSGRQ